MYQSISLQLQRQWSCSPVWHLERDIFQRILSLTTGWSHLLGDRTLKEHSVGLSLLLCTLPKGQFLNIHRTRNMVKIKRNICSNNGLHKRESVHSNTKNIKRNSYVFYFIIIIMVYFKKYNAFVARGLNCYIVYN